MKVEIEDLSSVEKKITVEIPVERVNDEFELAYQEVEKTAKINGFRPGKAPRKIIEQYYKDHIRHMVLRKLIEETIEPALERKQIQPITEPILEFDELKLDAPFRYTLLVEVKPQVQLKQFKGLELEKEVVEISEEMVDKVIENLRERNAVFKELAEARPAQMGDLLLMDIKGESGGKELPSQCGEGVQYTLGKETYIPGLENHLLGISLGEKRTFSVKFSEEGTPEELKGKEVAYTVELKGLKEKILPELNDEFAKEVAGCQDLTELRKKIREKLEEHYQRISRLKLEQALLDQLVQLNPLEVPKRLVRKRAEVMARNFFNRLGIKDPSQEDLETLIQEGFNRAEKEIQAGFLLEAIIEQEKVELTPEKESSKLKELSERYQIDPSRIKEQMGEQVMERFRQQWLEEQALDFLLSQSKIKEKMVKPEQMDTGVET